MCVTSERRPRPRSQALASSQWFDGCRLQSCSGDLHIRALRLRAALGYAVRAHRGSTGEAMRRDAFSILRETLRWRVALVLAALISLLMLVLALLNTQLGLRDTAVLAWIVFAVCAACVAALLILPRALGSLLFFISVAALLVVVPAFGWYHDRNMQHWAYIFPPLLVLLAPARTALLGMLLYGCYVSALTAQLLPAIEVVRFASGYGLLVCFIYTYALLEERAAAMLRYLSDHDALSNCLNRRTFNEAVEQLSGTDRGAGQGCLLLIDIDHFKAINDQHGHLVGDRIITEVAAVLGQQLDADGALFRYGGEEFAVILQNADVDTGTRLAERLRAAVAAAEFQSAHISISAGVAAWQSGTGTVAVALEKADAALYAAKRAGRNRVLTAAAVST